MTENFAPGAYWHWKLATGNFSDHPEDAVYEGL